MDYDLHLQAYRKFVLILSTASFPVVQKESHYQYKDLFFQRTSHNNNFTYELQRWETVKSGFSHFADNDIGIAKITPCFENRKSVIFKNLKNKYGAGTTELHILRTNNEYIFNEYVFWFIKTDTFIKEGINNFTGAVGQQRIGKEFIAETLIPIPPLNEQVKICRTINKLMKKLDKISLNIV